MGYIGIKQQETSGKLKNRGSYSKWYWDFINATTTDDNNNNDDDNTPASTTTDTATTNKSNNNCNNHNNNNVIIIKIITAIKMKISSIYILFASCLIRWKKCSLTLCL